MKDLENSLLMELVRSLTGLESEQLFEFTQVKFLNQERMREQAVRLIRICLSICKNDKMNEYKKLNIYKELFPGEKFVTGKIDKVMVVATKMIRQFLLVKNYLKDENNFQQDRDLYKVAKERNISILSRYTLNRLRKQLAETSIKNADYFQKRFLIESDLHYEECLNNQKRGDLNIRNTLLSLEAFRLTNQFLLVNRLLLQLKVARVEIYEDIQYALECAEIPEHFLQESKSLAIYFEIYKLLKIKLPKLQDVEVLYELIIKFESYIDDEDLQEIYTYLRNFCAIILSSDLQQLDIYHFLHQLYKDNLRRGFLHYNGMLHPSRYLAVFDNAMLVGENEWALNFINQNRKNIIGDNENNDFYRLNMAIYSFYSRNFEDCLDLIPDSFVFADYSLRAKRLELMALFELQSELLTYKLDTFKMFLSRTSPKILSEHIRQIHSDFANLLHQIVYSTPGDVKRSELLVKRVHERKQAAEWRWLLEKAQELRHR